MKPPVPEVVERPIIFSAAMVLAILAGRKTMTRRLAWRRIGAVPTRRTFRMRNVMRTDRRTDTVNIERIVEVWTPWMSISIGDRLWVRENLRVCSEGLEYVADHKLLAETEAEWSERAADLWNRRAHDDGPDLHPTIIPSIHMPRWASRITLEVTGVKVEPLQNISYEDCRDEAVTCPIHGIQSHVGCAGLRRGFKELWGSLHGDSTWAENPDVVAISFRGNRGP